MIDLLLRHARMALPDGRVADGGIAIEDGRIAAVLDDPAVSLDAREVLDLDGRAVLPGLIDTHFHVGFHAPERDMETETRSAALGGVTTVCRYYRHLGDYGQSLAPEVERNGASSHVDYAIHLGLLTEAQLAGLRGWVEDFGIRSFKMYTCYKDDEGARLGIRGQDDGFLLDALAAMTDVGDVVANVHCENQEIVDRRRAQIARGASAFGLDAWSAARPAVAEAEAIRRVGFLAAQAGAELFIPHVSSDLALAAVEAVRREGTAVAAETCPHYLALDTGAPAGVLAKINPPIRAAGDAARLWDAVADGTIDVIGTDHGTTMLAGKPSGDVWSAVPGFAGVGTLLPVLLSRGVAGGRIGLGRIATLQARAAQVFRLPRKGRIEAGADADLVVVDTGLERTVDAADLGSASDFSVFEGERLRGWPVMTLLRGRVIARSGAVVSPPQGRYLPR